MGVDPMRSLIDRHPRLAAWLGLAAAMVIVLLVSVKDVGLQPTQWLAVIASTIVLAGLCVWIIGWE
jgi:hypothetical protein